MGSTVPDSVERYASVDLLHDPLHGYIPFVSGRGLPEGEVAEREVIDHAWVQRLRQIHQLQTARWVFPSGEHSRFQHVVGVMHVAGRAAERLYPSLRRVCPDVPSAAYVTVLMRLAGLLHDVGHGPFGHFFDDHYLRDYGLSHEALGKAIICTELGGLLRGVRRHPGGELAAGEVVDAEQIAVLISRPKSDDSPDIPRWLRMLRSLFSGIYTVDNMDFVLRDAYMTGYSTRAFDLERLLYYSFFSERGLAIHRRGVEALLRFVEARGELFRTVYFHRTVRAIDLTLEDLFHDSKRYLFPGSPLQHLREYQGFTEWSLLVGVERWDDDPDAGKRSLGSRWRRLLRREIPWKMVGQRNLVYTQQDDERASLFSRRELLERALREELPPALRGVPLKIDVARYGHRPNTRGPASGQNFLFDPLRGDVRPLEDDHLFRHLPVAQRVCRVYAQDMSHAGHVNRALDALLGNGHLDDLTNM